MVFDRQSLARFTVGATVLALAAAVAPAVAHVPIAREKAENLRHAAAEANAVIHGAVTKVDYRMSTKKSEGEEQIPHTFVTYSIREVVHGRVEGKTLTLRFIGGSDGRGRFLTVSGVPLFDVGHEDILFVQGNGKLDCPLVNCEYGRLRVYQNRVYNSRAKPIVEVRAGRVVTGTRPEPALLKVSFPTPAFDELIKRKDLQERMQRMPAGGDTAALRKRYEQEAPRRIEYAVVAPEAPAPRDGSAQIAPRPGAPTVGAEQAVRDMARTEAAKPSADVRERPAIATPALLQALKEQARQVPVRPERVAVSVDPDRPFTVRTPAVAKPAARAEQAVQRRESAEDRKERELLEKQDFDPVIRKTDR